MSPKHSPSIRRIPGLVMLVALSLASPARAADDDAEKALAKALARPLSAGSVAALVLHGTKPAAAPRLEEALAHQDPEVRAVAARVAFTLRLGILATPLVKALASEQNPLAGAEMVRALALIVGRPADDALFEHLARFDYRAADAWAEVVGRTRPADLLPRLAKLASTPGLGATLAARALVDGPGIAAAFGSLAPTSAQARVYVEMVGAATNRGELLPWPVLAVGLQAGGVPRHAVVRDLLRRRALEQPTPPEAEAALADLGRVTGDQDAWLVVALELARRTRADAGEPRSLDGAIAKITKDDLPAGVWRDPLLHTLRSDEEAALRAALGDALVARERWESPGQPVAAVKGPATVPAPAPLTRLLRPLTPSVLADVLAITGCKPRVDQAVAFDVAFRPSGQPRSISKPVVLGVANDRCQEAATLLTALDIAPGSGPVEAERSDIVLVGLRPDDLECTSVATKLSPRPSALGGTILPPRKVHQVQPFYPLRLQQEGAQGVVIIEAVISQAGCVVDATVLRTPNVGFNPSALLAVSQWRYEPTLLNGVAVPVIMVVTVSYTLQPR